MAKKITLDSDARPADVMSVVARTADELGYTLDRHGDTSATAHEGDREVKGSAFAMRARLGITIEPRRVAIKSETNGVGYAGGANNPFFVIRINSRYAKFTKTLKRELQQAGLA